MTRSHLRIFVCSLAERAPQLWAGLAVFALIYGCCNNAHELFIGLLLAITQSYPESSNLVLVRQCMEQPQREMLWQEFIRRFHGHLRAWALQALRTYQQKQIAHYREALDDVVQEVYVRLVQHDCHALRAFKGETEEALFGYLRVITRHVALNRVRENSAKKRPYVTESLDANFNERQHDGRSRHQSTPTAAQASNEELGLLELQDQINHLLDKVLHGPQKYRDKMLFQLCYFDGFTAEEIAEMPAINMNPHAVEVAINRVRHRLSKYSKQLKV